MENLTKSITFTLDRLHNHTKQVAAKGQERQRRNTELKQLLNFAGSFGAFVNVTMMMVVGFVGQIGLSIIVQLIRSRGIEKISREEIFNALGKGSRTWFFC